MLQHFMQAQQTTLLYKCVNSSTPFDRIWHQITDKKNDLPQVISYDIRRDWNRAQIFLLPGHASSIHSNKFISCPQKLRTKLKSPHYHVSMKTSKDILTADSTAY